ncbi:MAG: hypothetical protein WC595_04440 [Candidatus Nanoarchaeia archaeon]
MPSKILSSGILINGDPKSIVAVAWPTLEKILAGHGYSFSPPHWLDILRVQFIPLPPGFLLDPNALLTTSRAEFISAIEEFETDEEAEPKFNFSYGNSLPYEFASISLRISPPKNRITQRYSTNDASSLMVTAIGHTYPSELIIPASTILHSLELAYRACRNRYLTAGFPEMGNVSLITQQAQEGTTSLIEEGKLSLPEEES